MGKPPQTEAVEAGLNTGYKLGLSRRDRHNLVGYYHSGNTVGYRAALYLFPNDNKAFFISINTDSETANYEVFNKILISESEITEKIKPQNINNAPEDVSDWDGYYTLSPVRFEMFAYLDYLFGFVKVRWSGEWLTIDPFQSDPILLTPANDYLFRAEDRVTASHVLYKSEGKKVISDGLRTYEKTSGYWIGTMWLSMVIGILGLIVILIKGLILLFRQQLFGSEIMTIPFLSIISLIMPIPFFFNQSFLELGDLTIASFLLALVTGILPVSLLIGIWKVLKKKYAKDLLQIDALAIMSLLQWMIVLFAWEMIPFRLWI